MFVVFALFLFLVLFWFVRWGCIVVFGVGFGYVAVLLLYVVLFAGFMFGFILLCCLGFGEGLLAIEL